MEKQKANQTAIILSGVGVILILAGAFDVVPNMGNLFLFAGIAVLIIAGVVKKLGKGEDKQS